MLHGSHGYTTQVMRKVITNKCLTNYVSSANFNDNNLLKYCKTMLNTLDEENIPTELLPGFLTKLDFNQ